MSIYHLARKGEEGGGARRNWNYIWLDLKRAFGRAGNEKRSRTKVEEEGGEGDLTKFWWKVL